MLQIWIILIIFAVCCFIAYCAPSSDLLELQRSALLALESNVLDFAHNPFATDEDEEAPARCGRVATATASSVGRDESPKAKPPAAALRKRVTPYQSRKIAARQQFRCAICGLPFSEANLWDVDHIIPLHMCRGSREECNDLSNLRAIHRTCHTDVTAKQFRA